tara:strand:+ start:771 stop:887 length:117 start_codon:yes stop_codon:yes gene_type:complete
MLNKVARNKQIILIVLKLNEAKTMDKKKKKLIKDLQAF